MEENRCPGCMQLKTKTVCEHCGFDERKENSKHQLPVGTVLHGQYVIGKVLGQGGFGITYLGWDSYMKIPVAIKEYYPSGIVMRDCSYSNGVSNCEGQTGSGFDRNRRRFLREAQSLAKLNDVPEVVHVLGYFPENETAYIVMEYIRGQTLKKKVQKDGPLDSRQMASLFGPVLDGLQQVHDAGLIHRDISPDNIMLLPDGGVKLLDFGAVRDYGAEHSSSTEAILKPGYAPLEQYQRHAELAPQTDLYALCGTIYYCLTGKIPPDAPERMMEGAQLEWDSIPGLTEGQRDALRRGTALSMQDRIATAAELKQLLTADQQVDVPPARNPKTEKQDKPHVTRKQPAARKRIRKLPILAGIVVILSVWVLVYGSTASQPEEPQNLAVPETTEDTLPPETQTTVPETTEAVTEPNEPPVYPCYVTYTDNGMVAEGDGLNVEVRHDRDLMVTIDGFPVKGEYTVRKKDGFEDSVSWVVTIYAGEHSYTLNAQGYSMENGEEVTWSLINGSHSLSMSIGPKAYVVAGDAVDITVSSNGMLWRCPIPNQSQADRIPVANIPFDYRSITGFAVDGYVSTADEAYNLDYHRVYEIAGELPEETQEQPQQTREYPYKTGYLKEKYDFTTTVTPELTRIEGEYLDIGYTNDREITVTLHNVIVDERYLVRPSGSENTGTWWYGWLITLRQGNGYLELRTVQSTMGRGGDFWVTPEYMEHAIWWYDETNGASYYGYTTDVQFTPDSVTWKYVIPEETSGWTDHPSIPLAFDIHAVTEIEASFWSGEKELQVDRTYTPS